MIEKFNFLNTQEHEAVLDAARILNKQFSDGKNVWKENTLHQIRNLPKPIVVDFNGVMVNQHRPWHPNPQAKDFLDQLVKLGTVLIVTNAYGDWNLRQQALESFGL